VVIIREGRTRSCALHSTNKKIFLLNMVLLSVESSKSLNNDCTMITDDHCYCWCENCDHHALPSLKELHCNGSILRIVTHTHTIVNSKLSRIEIGDEPQWAPPSTETVLMAHMKYFRTCTISLWKCIYIYMSCLGNYGMTKYFYRHINCLNYFLHKYTSYTTYNSEIQH